MKPRLRTKRNWVRLSKLAADSMRAIDVGTVPPIVYMPAQLRTRGMLRNPKILRIQIDPPTIKEEKIRIKECDPLGFLIAIMNGQMIPQFTISQERTTTVKYLIPDLELRARVARFLALRNTKLAKQPDNLIEYEAMIEQAAEQGRV